MLKAKYGIAVDQHGRVFRFGKHPRRDLLEQLGRKRADKMFQDKKDGRTVHVGYVIAGHWLTIYAPVEVAL